MSEKVHGQLESGVNIQVNDSGKDHTLTMFEVALFPGREKY